MKTRFDAAGVRNLATFLDDAARRWPDQPWLHTPSGDVSRAETLANARSIAGSLRDRGVRPNDRVVVVLPNSIEFVEVWFALVLLGAVTSAINPASVASELDDVIAQLQPHVVIVGDEAVGERAVPVVRLAELLTDHVSSFAEPHPSLSDQPVSLIQSSGSTGKPKFIIETNLMYVLAAEGMPMWVGLDETDVMLTSLPLSHLNAQAYSVLGSWGCGAKLVLLPRFSASGFWETVHKYGVTEYNAIGAMVEILMHQPESGLERDNPLRIVYSAPAPVEQRHREIEERWGCRLVVGYALSDSPYGLVCPIDEPVVYGSMGRPRQHPDYPHLNEARVVTPEGEPVPDGTVGELELRSAAITPGYLGLTDETERLRRPDGWLRTGDLATRDEAGNYFFAGRSKEIIRRRGENIAPAEIENVFDAFPGVIASAAVGVPSELGEEDVKAFLQTEAGRPVDIDAIVTWCSERLPPFKRPRYVEFVDRFPLTETKKIAKRQRHRHRTADEFDLEKL